MSDSKFPSLCNRRNAAIMGLVCRLLAGEGRGNLSTFCPYFVSNITRKSQRLHDYDSASHLRLQNPYDLKSLNCFIRGWQVTAVMCWNKLPANILLCGERDGWRTILKDVQRLFNNDNCMYVYLVIENEVHHKKINK